MAKEDRVPSGLVVCSGARQRFRGATLLACSADTDEVRVNSIRGWYYMLFIVLYRVDASRLNRVYREWTTLAVYVMFQVLLLAAADLWVEMATGVSVFLSLSRSNIVAVCFVLGVANYYGLLHRHMWTRYEVQFEALPASTRRIRIAVAICVMLGVVALVVFSFYRFGEFAFSRYGPGRRHY